MRDAKNWETQILILADLLVAGVGLALIWIGTLTPPNTSLALNPPTIAGWIIFIIALFGLLLSSRIRRGWVEIGIIVFIVVGVLAFFQPTISQGAWPPFSPTNTPSVSSCETFILSLDKIQSDLDIFKTGSNPVVILLVVGNQTYHYNASIEGPIIGITGSPVASSYSSEKNVRIQLVLDLATLENINTFTNQLASASTVYFLPSTAKPASCSPDQTSK